MEPEPDAPDFYVVTFGDPARAAAAAASVREHHPLSRVTALCEGYGEAQVAALREAAPGLRVLQAPFPGSGELGALRCFWEGEGGDEAVVFRDDALLVAPLPPRCPHQGAAPLWSCRRVARHRIGDSLAVLSSLYMSPDKTLKVIGGLMRGPGSSWLGCSGLRMAVTRGALRRLHDDTGVFCSEVLRGIDRPERLEAAARVLSVLLHMDRETTGGCLLASLCGDATSPRAGAPFQAAAQARAAPH